MIEARKLVVRAFDPIPRSAWYGFVDDHLVTGPHETEQEALEAVRLVESKESQS